MSHFYLFNHVKYVSVSHLSFGNERERENHSKEELMMHTLSLCKNKDLHRGCFPNPDFNQGDLSAVKGHS